MSNKIKIWPIGPDRNILRTHTSRRLRRTSGTRSLTLVPLRLRYNSSVLLSHFSGVSRNHQHQHFSEPHCHPTTSPSLLLSDLCTSHHAIPRCPSQHVRHHHPPLLQAPLAPTQTPSMKTDQLAVQPVEFAPLLPPLESERTTSIQNPKYPRHGSWRWLCLKRNIPMNRFGTLSLRSMAFTRPFRPFVVSRGMWFCHRI